uniref:Uncharacterized protein n=1 Tax=Anguilla anguilla TaxID=7936 RepID=A0A0E9Q537_ANGAN
MIFLMHSLKDGCAHTGKEKPICRRNRSQSRSSGSSDI